MKKILICINISLLMVIFTEILFMFLSKSPTAEEDLVCLKINYMLNYKLLKDLDDQLFSILNIGEEMVLISILFNTKSNKINQNKLGSSLR